MSTSLFIPGTKDSRVVKLSLDAHSWENSSPPIERNNNKAATPATPTNGVANSESTFDTFYQSERASIATDIHTIPSPIFIMKDLLWRKARIKWKTYDYVSLRSCQSKDNDDPFV